MLLEYFILFIIHKHNIEMYSLAKQFYKIDIIRSMIHIATLTIFDKKETTEIHKAVPRFVVPP